jgi:hypothetical protein
MEIGEMRVAAYIYTIKTFILICADGLGDESFVPQYE